MKILALEFSSAQRSVAVLAEGAGAGAAVLGEANETGTRATRAFGLIEEALRQARLEREQIECLAVGLGPGSYVGIRLAISLAQGWQLARPVQLLGASSAEGLAVQAQADGLRGRIGVVIDAQRGEFYLADYELTATARREVGPLRLVPGAEVLARQQAGVTLLGPEVAQWFPGSRMLFPRAAAIGQLAQGRRDFIAGEKLEPIYLREARFVKAPPARVGIPRREGLP
ncbi:MAG TPA: tRNA (adenosine(37)-N6)-threonylcarbamoyltransferase complex dimerization subunit type 1 TsaB [Candidatus Paceibacterota bacterium]|jgi:tRNA threonylcarbamoyl adenosine modification protein YeaZ|nr:tRNA (adenosine(37)-N6)-threonylcarbamoyltransferase complex dimerization subunit type 1 TsaB [Verrucomicrobiota bacterium]HRY58966.1 tRNA (adenosine(37)-N6)-threonylcarbamoyltransferase complex dimerization subunit type 1 TsaB [Candidatus Paceibacterota bacterium]HOW78327.1 tRNA (adenosine(37)-N6)-threonylcarbamoyltransferase complex dimerization subunit type 1 TsaB [Verrucomicrobiota bacterium]HQE89915.1 tRNA (adenosine(37)-N6)-threonylcarbamoyltransferase complex dimerization subunit type 